MAGVRRSLPAEPQHHLEVNARWAATHARPATEQLVREEAAAGREADAGLRTARSGSRSPASSAHARCGASGPASASARAIPVSSRSPRIVASTSAAVRIDRSRAAGRQPSAPTRRRARARRGTRRAAPRSSAGPPRRTRAPPARPPRTGVAPSRRGCGGSRARAGPSSRSRSRGSRPRRGARRRCAYCAAARSSSCSSIAFVRQRRAPGRVGRWSPSRPGEPLRVRVVEGQRVRRDVVGAERERGVERRRPGRLALPGHVVQQVERHRPDARLARLGDRVAATSRGRCRRPSRRSSPSSNDCAPSETRVTPASTSARASPRSSGPGFASIVTSAPVGQAEALAHALEDRGDRRRPAAASACRRRGRRVSSGGRRGPERGVGSVRPQVDLGQQRADERLDARPRPARRGPRVHDEVAVRAQRDAERDVDVERDRRPRRRSRPGPRRRPPGYWSRDASPESSTRQPLGVACRRATSSPSVPLAFGMPGVAGREEDRDPRDRVAEERRADAARDPGQPAAGEADRERGAQHVPRPPRRPEPRRQRVDERLDEVREVRLEPGGRAGSRTAAPGTPPRRRTPSRSR